MMQFRPILTDPPLSPINRAPCMTRAPTPMTTSPQTLASGATQADEPTRGPLLACIINMDLLLQGRSPNLRDGATLPKIAEIEQTAWLSALHRRRMRNRASSIGVLQIRTPCGAAAIAELSLGFQNTVAGQRSLCKSAWEIHEGSRRAGRYAVGHDCQRPHRTDSRASHGGARRLGPPSTSAGLSMIALAGNLRNRAFGLALHPREQETTGPQRS